MSTLTLTEAVTINLEGACDHSSCAELAFRIHNQLNTPNYTQGMSVMRCPDSLEEWQGEHRTARKRAWRAERLGYRFEQVDLSLFNEDVFDINTSLETRQGRPMSSGYLRRINRGPLPDYPCARHAIRTYGVLKDQKLVAYMTVYRVGQLAMVSMIIGHGAHLQNDIMYLLFAGMVDEQWWQGGYLFYNRFDSGTDGLRYYKERVGFGCCDIDWVLG